MLEFSLVRDYAQGKEDRKLLRKEVIAMALYMDIHRNVGNIEKEKLDEAHKKDLAVQGKYGVKITDFWHSEKDGAVF